MTMFGAKSWSSSAQTLANATLTAVTFGTNLVNRGSVWSGGANTKFTVPTGGAGTWLVNAGVVFANNTTGIREMFVRKNGSTYVARVGPPAATGTNQSQVLITYVDPSAADADYYEIIVRQDSGGNLNTIVVDSGYTWATAVKIA